MFRTKQNTPQTPVSEPYSLEIKIRLSEASLIILISILVAILLGSGAWTQIQAIQPPSDLPSVSVMNDQK